MGEREREGGRGGNHRETEGGAITERERSLYLREAVLKQGARPRIVQNEFGRTKEERDRM